MDSIPEKPQPSRVHRKQDVPFPKEEDLRTLFRHMDGRFTPQEKSLLILYGSHGLDYESWSAIKLGSDHWPNTPAVHGGWDDLVFAANVARRAQRLPQVDEAGRKRLITGAKKWTAHFIRYGDLWAAEPHKPGWKVERNRPVLTRMREIMLDCYFVDDQRVFYSGTEDAVERNDEFKALFEQLGVSHAVLWTQLTALFPGLHVSKQPVHRVRDAHETQVTSSAQCVACMPAPDDWQQPTVL